MSDPSPAPAVSGNSRRTAARWEDYFAQQAAPAAQPRLTLTGVVDLETGDEVTDPTTIVTTTPTSSATDAAPAVQAQPGPFEIPDLTPAPARVARVSRLKLAAVLFFAAVWGTLAYLPGPKPAVMPRVTSFAAVPSTGYLRYSNLELTGLPVTWMARIDNSLIVVVKPGWEKLQQNAKVEGLRRLKALAETPAEILILGPESEMYAETYEDFYHIYR